MTVKSANSVSVSPVPAKTIPVGTTFYGHVVGYPNSLKLMAFERIIDLEDPYKTWIVTDIDILDYEPVDAHVVVDSLIAPCRRNTDE